MTRDKAIKEIRLFGFSYSVALSPRLRIFASLFVFDSIIFCKRRRWRSSPVKRAATKARMISIASSGPVTRAPKTEHVAIVMLARLMRRVGVGAERRAHAAYLVGRDRNARAAPADENANLRATALRPLVRLEAHSPDNHPGLEPSCVPKSSTS